MINWTVKPSGYIDDTTKHYGDMFGFSYNSLRLLWLWVASGILSFHETVRG